MPALLHTAERPHLVANYPVRSTPHLDTPLEEARGGAAPRWQVASSWLAWGPVPLASASAWDKWLELRGHGLRGSGRNFGTIHGMGCLGRCLAVCDSSHSTNYRFTYFTVQRLPASPRSQSADESSLLLLVVGRPSRQL